MKKMKINNYKIAVIALMIIVGCNDKIDEELKSENTEKLISSSYYSSTESCDSVNYFGYPSQQLDQYLHPEAVLSSGKDHNVIFDHLVTRKMLNVFNVETLCNIDLWILNNDTSSIYYDKIIHFTDIYNWTDDLGNPLFNLNYELYKYWGYTEGTMSFPIISINTITEEDMSMNHDYISLRFEGIDTVSYYH